MVYERGGLGGSTYNMQEWQKLAECFFEVGPIRPPSEAYSLLIRATRNCPWNKCEFCPVYKGQKFELRPVDEVLRDIEAATRISDTIHAMAKRAGQGSSIRDMAAMVYNNNPHNPSVQNVASWLYNGGKHVFIQDANSLIMQTPDLAQVVTSLKKSFPQVERITSYARSKTAAKKTLDELKKLHAAGLSRLHIGLESGCDEVLAFMQKGVIAEEHIKGGKAVVESGISLSEYVMPGLGGRKWSNEHATETARVLNEINPDYIRVRTLEVHQIMPLWEKVRNGELELLTEDEMVEEIGVFIERLECHSTLKSDHMLNLLMEVEGDLPDDKDKILAPVKKYLSLPYKERISFVFGRRAGLYQTLEDIQDVSKREQVERSVHRIESEHHERIEYVISRLKRGFI